MDENHGVLGKQTRMTEISENSIIHHYVIVQQTKDYTSSEQGLKLVVSSVKQ